MIIGWIWVGICYAAFVVANHAGWYADAAAGFILGVMSALLWAQGHLFQAQLRQEVLPPWIVWLVWPVGESPLFSSRYQHIYAMIGSTTMTITLAVLAILRDAHTSYLVCLVASWILGVYLVERYFTHSLTRNKA